MSYGLGHWGLGFPHWLPHHQATQLARMPAHAWHRELQWPHWHDTGIPSQPFCSWNPAPCAAGWSSWCVAAWHSWAAGHSLCWWWVFGQQGWFLLLLYHRVQALTARREMQVCKQAVTNLLPYVWYLNGQTASWIYKWICQKPHKSGISHTATISWETTVYVYTPHYTLMHLWKQQIEFQPQVSLKLTYRGKATKCPEIRQTGRDFWRSFGPNLT